MATFYVLNNKKYRTSVRLRDGRMEAIRFEPEVYFGGIGESTSEDYTSSPNEIPVDLESLLPDPDNAIRE